MTVLSIVSVRRLISEMLSKGRCLGMSAMAAACESSLAFMEVMDVCRVVMSWDRVWRRERSWSIWALGTWVDEAGCCCCWGSDDGGVAIGGSAGRDVSSVGGAGRFRTGISRLTEASVDTTKRLISKESGFSADAAVTPK